MPIELPVASPPAKPRPTVTHDLPVAGMTCAGCVARIERALRAVPGVRAASVSLATGRARVELDQGAEFAALVQAVASAGYAVPLTAAAGGARPDPAARLSAMRAAEESEQRGLRRDASVALAFTVPLMVLAMSHGALPGTGGTWAGWAQLALAAPVVFGPGARFLRRAAALARRGQADMSTLVALGALAAFGGSTAALLAGGGHAGHAPPLYFEAAAAIVAFVLAGKWLEARARGRLSDAVRGLVALAPPFARRLRDGDLEELPVAALVPGDRVLVRPGERLPADGVIEDGAAALDESLLTGESLPVERRAGDAVSAGTLHAAGGALAVRVTRAGADSALARLVEAVERAQDGRASAARVADALAARFVPAVLALSLLAGAAWALADPSPAGLLRALEFSVAVLVIACPCALGLATPAAVAAGAARGAQLGVLVKGGAALEAAARVDTVLLDKTGTLTAGRPELVELLRVAGPPEDELLALLAAAERGSEHPLAQAVLRAAQARGLRLPEAQNLVSRAGAGVEARVAGRRVRLGTAAWLAQGGVDVAALEPRAAALARAGRTPLLAALDGHAAAVLGVQDAPAPGAREALEALRSQGLRLALVSGDRAEVAADIGAQVGLADVHAPASPEDKAALVARLRAEGRVVAMVGDGVNDAPALAGADVGVALGHGTDIAAASADVVLLHGGLAGLPRALALARATRRTIRRNLFWACAYNAVAIPVAAGVLVPFGGPGLSPVLASAAMALSSVSVLASSLALRRFGSARRSGGLQARGRRGMRRP